LTEYDNPFVQAAVDEPGAPDAQALLRDAPLALVQLEHGIDHLEGGDVRLVDRGREEDGLEAVQAKFIGRQEARVREVQPEAPAVACRDIAHLIGHHHDPVLFENNAAVRHGAYYKFAFSECLSFGG